ncbi:MAG: phage portal protein [Chloroflexota bacterium]
MAQPTGQRRDGGGGDGSRNLSIEGPMQRLKAAIQLVRTGTVDTDWFGPGTPMAPVAPEAIEGRQHDLPVNYNILIQTKSEGMSFGQLRWYAYAAEIVRILIENRINTLTSMAWTIQPIGGKKTGPQPDKPAAAEMLEAFFKFPDLEHDWGTWLGMWLEDSFVIDAATLFVHRTNGGYLHALRPIDGATIKRIIDEHGWTPPAPEVAYQQILKGVPALSYTTDEMIYRMRRPGTYRIYGLSRVEQILVMIRLWMYREASNLEYYDKGSVPDGFLDGGEGWTASQLKEYQDLLDVALSGQMGERRKLKVAPHGSKYTATKEPALKNDYDDTLIRIACFCFGTSPTPFIKQMNRATAESAKESSSEEGVASDMTFVKSVMNEVIQRRLGFTDLEFEWQDKEAQDPLERGQVDALYLDRGVYTPDEVRADLGKAPLPDGEGARPRMQTTEQNIGPDGLPTGQQPVTKPGDDSANPAKPGTKDKKAAKAALTLHLLKVGQANMRPVSIRAKGQPVVTKVAPREFPPVQEAQRQVLAGTFQTTLQELRDQVVAQVGKLTAEKMAKAATDDEGTQRPSWDPDEIAAGLNLDALSLAWDDTNNALILTAQDGSQTTVATITVDDPGAGDITGKANADAVTWAREHAAELLGKDGSGGMLSDTTRAMLKRSLTDAFNRGLTPDALAAELIEDYAFSDTRALLIAETEIAMANSHGQLMGYTAAGLTEKSWLLSNDEGVCPVCEGNAKKGWIPIGDKFPGGVQAPLQHPNCRCAITARKPEAKE